MKTKVPSNCVHQKGTILIIAVLMVALVQILILSVIRSHSLEIRYTHEMINNIQNQQYLLGAEAWGVGQVQDIMPLGVNQAVYTLPPTAYDNRIVEAHLIDLQSKININALSSFNRMALINAFKTQLPDLSDEQIFGIIDKIKSEVLAHKSNLSSKNLKTVLNYLSRTINSVPEPKPGLYPNLSLEENPYFVSITELLSFDEINSNLFQIMMPTLTALPQTTAVNINTAPGPVLLALSQTWTPEIIQKIIAQRKQNGPYHSVDDFLNQSFFTESGVKKEDFTAINITVLSQYFLCESRLTMGDHILTLYSLIQAAPEKNALDPNKMTVRVLWRSFGSL